MLGIATMKKLLFLSSALPISSMLYSPAVFRTFSSIEKSSLQRITSKSSCFLDCSPRIGADATKQERRRKRRRNEKQLFFATSLHDAGGENEYEESFNTADDEMALIEEDLIADADAIFQELDVNGDGEVSNEELRSYLENTGCSQEIIRGLFTALDTNADGGISLEEMRFAFANYESAALYTAFGLGSDVTSHAIQTAVNTVRSEAGVDDRVKKDASPEVMKLLSDLVFDMIDTDNSGEIDTQELREHFLNVNSDKEETLTSVDGIFSALDIDSDGTISRDEMREGFYNYDYHALKKALGLEM